MQRITAPKRRFRRNLRATIGLRFRDSFGKYAVDETMNRKTSRRSTALTARDEQTIHELIENAEIVEGPDDLYAIVAELWPELLHKVKPPRSLMH